MFDRRTLIGSGLAAAGVAALPKSALAHVIVPEFKLYDTHGHFYTNDADKYPFNSRTSRYGPEIMVAKAMRFPQTPKEVFAFWDENNIAKGAGVQYSSTYRFDNRYLLDISAEHPDRIIPVVILDPEAEDTPAQLEKMARENKIAGVRWTGSPTPVPGQAAGPGNRDNDDFAFLSPTAAHSWEAANRLGLLVVLMPIGGNTPGAMAKVAQHANRYPNVNILLDHIGFPRAELGPDFGLSPQHRELAQLSNVYYKYTTLLIEQLHAAHVPFQPFLEHMVQTFGANKMTWGSDVGNTPGSMFMWVQHALDSASGLSQEQQRDLFYNTAERIHVPGGRGPAR
ncbi:MAG TPA: amidohydrolase family protein [Croceibacterium sp.]|nr:amidohydrolase family protein [Croceibacterium sp.]